MDRQLLIKTGLLTSSLLASGIALAAEPAAWISPAAWPWQTTLTAERSATLFVIEENGINLVLQRGTEGPANSPGRQRIAPEFVLLEAGDSASVQLQPYYQHTGRGQFRITALPVPSAAEHDAAALLAKAGLLNGSADPALQAQACEHYEQVATQPALTGWWQGTAAYLAAACRMEASLPQKPELLAALPAQEVRFLLPLHIDWLRGFAAFALDDNTSAVPLFRSALQKAEALLSEQPDYREAITREMAAIQADLGGSELILTWREAATSNTERLDAAEDLLDQALATAQRLQDPPIIANAYDFKAAVNLVRGNDPGIIENLLLSKAAISQGGHDEEMIPVLGSIGDYHKKWGNWRAAMDAYLEAIEKVESSGNVSGADSYHNLASLYQTLGDLPRALHATELAVQGWERVGNEWRANNLKQLLGVIYEDQGDFERARALLSSLLEHHRALENPWDPMRVLTQAALSRVEAKLHHDDVALALSDELLAHVKERQFTDNLQRIPIYVNAAKLAMQHRSFDEAHALLRDALDNIAVQPAERIDVMFALQELYQQANRSADAIAIADRAFALIESQQVQIESSRLGPYWAGKTQNIYQSHAQYLLEHRDDAPDFIERAYVTVERARASSLRLRRQEVLLTSQSGNAQAQAEWQGILERTQKSFGNSQSDEETLEQARAVSTALERFYASYADGVDLKTPAVLSLHDTAAAIPGDTLFLDYVVGSSRVWRFAFHGGQWQVDEVGDNIMLNALTDAALAELSNSSSRSNQNTQLLSSYLLRDLPARATPRQLLISPAASMSSLPFSALVHREEPLVAQSAVTMVPSISEYLSTTATPSNQSRDGLELALFADPAFNLTQANGLLAANDTLRSWSTTLQRLPSTALEAASVSRLFPTERRQVFTGLDATQSQLFSPAVRNARILHIATHGYFDEHNPELVGLALTPQAGDDGFVSMAELASERFASDLVVISACSTGQGEYIPGEGNMSLARTFLAQGVDSVISTLWPVSDRATALFMQKFYEALMNDKLSYALALQKAQQALRDTTQYRNPFYWSAYTLTSVAAP